MPELSLRSRLDRYEAEAEAGAAAYEDRWIPAGASTPELRLTLPSFMAQPKPAHLAIMRAVDGILTMGLTHPNVAAAPAPLRTMVRMLRRYESLMLEELAKIDEGECVKYMRTLAAAITQLADSVEPGAHHANGAAGPDHPRLDQPEGS